MFLFVLTFFAGLFVGVILTMFAGAMIATMIERDEQLNQISRKPYDRYEGPPGVSHVRVTAIGGGGSDGT